MSGPESKEGEEKRQGGGEHPVDGDASCLDVDNKCALCSWRGKPSVVIHLLPTINMASEYGCDENKDLTDEKHRAGLKMALVILF